MPRYEPDMSKVDATIILLDKGEYEFEIGKPKAFERTNKKGVTSIGIRYPMVVTEGQYASKRTFYTCYTHTDGALSFAKQFVMAALGYSVTRSGEERFNKDYPHADWSHDTESGECGDMWLEAAGKHVVASVDLGVNPENDEPNQAWKRFRPLESAEV